MRTVGVVCEDPGMARWLADAARRDVESDVIVAPVRNGVFPVALTRGVDVLVLDGPSLQGRRRWPVAAVPVVVAVADATPSAVFALAASGAGAVVEMSDAPSSVPLAVRAVVSGMCLLPQRALKGMFEQQQQPPPAYVDMAGTERLERLTARESEVLAHLMVGEGHREIASELHLSVHTVRFHVKQILIKLRVHSGLEAAMLASRGGMHPAHRHDEARAC